MLPDPQVLSLSILTHSQFEATMNIDKRLLIILMSLFVQDWNVIIKSTDQKEYLYIIYSYI